MCAVYTLSAGGGANMEPGQEGTNDMDGFWGKLTAAWRVLAE